MKKKLSEIKDEKFKIVGELKLKEVIANGENYIVARPVASNGWEEVMKYDPDTEVEIVDYIPGMEKLMAPSQKAYDLMNEKLDPNEFTAQNYDKEVIEQFVKHMIYADLDMAKENIRIEEQAAERFKELQETGKTTWTLPEVKSIPDHLNSFSQYIAGVDPCRVEGSGVGEVYVHKKQWNEEGELPETSEKLQQCIDGEITRNANQRLREFYQSGLDSLPKEPLSREQIEAEGWEVVNITSWREYYETDGVWDMEYIVADGMWEIRHYKGGVFYGKIPDIQALRQISKWIGITPNI